jgi:cell wall-associated NlpC family hydrolase
MRRFVGIPYVEGGRDYDGTDCWGLCWLFYRDELGRSLPSFSGEYRVEDREILSELIHQSKALVNAVPTREPEYGDLVLMKFRALPVHVGVYIDDQHVLHILKGINSVVESMRSPRLTGRIEGWYRVK